jgi:hypothetical protein
VNALTVALNDVTALNISKLAADAAAIGNALTAAKAACL